MFCDKTEVWASDGGILTTQRAEGKVRVGRGKEGDLTEKVCRGDFLGV